MMGTLLTLATLGLLAGSPAAAEELRAPLVEIGGNLCIVLPILFEDGPRVLVGGGPRLTINVTQRIGVEMMADAFRALEGSDLNGLYLTQIRFPLRKSPDGHRTLALTLGAAGAFAYRHHAEVRVSRPDRSTLVYPEYRTFRAGKPHTAAIGVAWERVLGSYAACSFGVQGLLGSLGGFAVRATGGVSFGRRKAR